MLKAIYESDVEENVFATLENLGYKIFRGDDEESRHKMTLNCLAIKMQTQKGESIL